MKGREEGLCPESRQGGWGKPRAKGPHWGAWGPPTQRADALHRVTDPCSDTALLQTELGVCSHFTHAPRRKAGLASQSSYLPTSLSLETFNSYGTNCTWRPPSHTALNHTWGASIHTAPNHTWGVPIYTTPKHTCGPPSHTAPSGTWQCC